MTFAQYAARNNADARVLVEMDLGLVNVQWVNAGAGVWCVNPNNSYSWVDSTLVESGFSAQGFSAIGSVRADGQQLTQVTTLLAVSSTVSSFYWDSANSLLYIHLDNHDAPDLHAVEIGVVYGYSFDDFTPPGTEVHYDGRLRGSPRIQKRRDPLYFGKISYSGGDVELANGDGAFDTFAQENSIYGNEVRIYLGYSGLDRDEYERIFTGYVETVTVSEEAMRLQVADKRKQLTAPVEYLCVASNALDAIVDVLQENYAINYTSTYFDTTAWASAQACVETVTVNMQSPDSTISVVEGICSSVFGLFLILPDGRYSFRLVNTSASSETTIRAADIQNRHSITYDPTEVISSARIGYARDWEVTEDQYYWYTETSYETSVFNTYKTYNQRDFTTYLVTATAATAYAGTIMAYSRDVHGTFEAEVPMSYYERDIGEMVDVEIERFEGSGLLGTKKCEILGVTFNLDRPSITFELRVA